MTSVTVILANCLSVGGEPICLPGCESLPGTIGCLRCFDRIFP